MRVALLVQPDQYVTGMGWRTSRTKILDNALIGFCKVELSERDSTQSPQPGNVPGGGAIAPAIGALEPPRTSVPSLVDATGEVQGDLAPAALAFAMDWHGDQERKGTEIPYVSHLLGVASLVLEGGGAVDLHVPAAFLHDVVEDTEATVEDVETMFGTEIAAIVRACGDKEHSDDPPPWVERKARYVEHLLDVPADALLVSLADKVHNCSALADDYGTTGPALWEGFNEGTAGQIWYYRSLLQVFEERRADLELFAVDRHGLPGGGGWLLDRHYTAFNAFEELAEEGEPDALCESWGYGPRLPCPICHTRALLPILYGMPGSSLAQAAKKDTVVLGGCIVDQDQANWLCVECDRSYVTLRPATEAVSTTSGSLPEFEA